MAARRLAVPVAEIRDVNHAYRARTGEDRSSLYDEITDKIIAELEAGRVPWVQPWGTAAAKAPLAIPKNASTARHYSGVNVLILWGGVIERGFTGQSWLTFRQALSLGGHVRKGERGTTVVYADRFVPSDEKQRAAETGEEAQVIPFLKRFTVFNTDQCEDLPPDIVTAAPPPPPGVIEPRVEALIKATGINFRIGGHRAFYAPAEDFVQVPPPQAYFEPINWHRTASLCRYRHKTHATGAKHRLDRDLTGRFGSAKYAMDEVIVELTSSFIMADLGIAHRARAEHAAYIASWIKILKDDPRAIFTAAGKAQAAADWMHAQQTRHMLTGDSVDIDTIAVPLAQPDQAMHRSELLRADNRANTQGGASHQGGRLHSHLAARR